MAKRKGGGFTGHRHSPESKAKISNSMRRVKGPTPGLDGPSRLGGGGGPIRTIASALGSQIKQDVGNKIRSGLMLRPSIAPDEKHVTVSASRRERNSGGKQRFTDTITIQRGTDYKTSRTYEKYRRPVQSKQRAALTRKAQSTTGGRARGIATVSPPRGRGL